MGPVLAYKKLLELLGHEVILPPRPTQRTIELGVKYSPEFICFPFKIILGSYIEAIEQGAELVVTSGGIGACRAVYYGALSEKILRQLGYHIRFLVFDNFLKEFPTFYRQAQEIRNRKTMPQVLSALYLSFNLIYILDKYEKTINKLRPYENVPGTCNQKWQDIRRLIGGSNNSKELKTNINIADQIIAGIATSPKENIIKIGLVGEIYLVMEGSMNNELEDKLAKMGVEVIRYKYISHWLKNCIWPPYQVLRKAERYLKYGIGGHEKENIGYMIKYKEMGFDGIIHLMPFGCMPELVTQTIIPTLTRDLDFPILSLSLDEQTGWVNNQIRLEAFIDLLRNRKELLKEG
jgi:predicted nucleotide-binding protein (sugar kinase/HSP70/actin superfamily)